MWFPEMGKDILNQSCEKEKKDESEDWMQGVLSKAQELRTGWK